MTPNIKNMAKLIFQSLVGIGILLALLFLPAGRWDWWMAWIFIGAYIGTVFIAVAVLNKKDPELVDERQVAKGDTKKWDKIITNIFGLVLVPSILITAGFDHRFRWSAPFSLTIQILGILVGLLSFILVFWGMFTNTYFSSYVRIQEDRGHTTVSTGPYRYVRHPGYVGMILSVLMIPLVLGSWLALIPGGLAAILMIVRTALEDKTLQEELPGYKEFAKNTRYRLVPGIW